MTINDPIVIWGLGLVVLIASAFIGFMDRRIANNRKDIDLLKQQMAGHDSNKEMLDRMYNELQALTGLTNRIAGHLNIK